MKVAKVKFGWSRSRSSDIKEQLVTLTVDGEKKLNSSVVAPEIEEVIFDVAAKSSVSLLVEAVDTDGNVTPSELYSFVLSDLEAPQPPTNLFHEILSVVDVPDEVVVVE